MSEPLSMSMCDRVIPQRSPISGRDDLVGWVALIWAGSPFCGGTDRDAGYVDGLPKLPSTNEEAEIVLRALGWQPSDDGFWWRAP